MDLETACNIIESCPGFDDETSSVGEAWAFVVQDHAHLYRALQLLLGRVNDTPWHEVSDRDVQSWINFAKKKLEHES